MIFKKEILLNKIAEYGDYNAIQYISQSSFFLSLLLVWFITIIIFLLVAFVPDRQRLWLAFSIAMIFNLCGIVLIILGVLPSLLTFPNLALT